MKNKDHLVGQLTCYDGDGGVTNEFNDDMQLNLSGDVGVPVSVTINEAGIDVVTSLDPPDRDIQ